MNVVVAGGHGDQEDTSGERERLYKLYEFERQAYAAGKELVAGVDEVGRGPLAGPVVSAAVVLPPGCFIPGLKDSKQVSPGQRRELAGEIRRLARDWSVAAVPAARIDRVNILKATIESMSLAVQSLTVFPDHIIIDALRLPGVPVSQNSLVGGDRLSASVAAASIIAKVERDDLMVILDRLYPGYFLGRHKGYPTPLHREIIAKLGPSPIHRLSYRLLSK